MQTHVHTMCAAVEQKGLNLRCRQLLEGQGTVHQCCDFETKVLRLERT